MRWIWILFLIAACLLLATPFLDDFRLSMGGILLTLGCFALLAFQFSGLQKQIGELARLRAAYDQLDQQAKFIIKTDIELHRTQEELDRRLASLMSLHTLGKQLQVNEQPDAIFKKLDAGMVSNFGFSKGLLGICPDGESIDWRSMVGVNAQTAERVRGHLAKSGLLKQMLSRTEPLTLQASQITDGSQKMLIELLEIPTAVLARINPAAGPTGCLILGRTGSGVNVKADEELVAIMSNQLQTAISNSALYEGIWNSQQELERKVLQRTHELAQANEELVRLNKAKSDFVSAVSHELRTPLAAIKGYASLLAGGQFGPLVTAQSERLLKIEKHSDLLTQLINNLLDIARIESGRVTMEKRVIPLEEFLNTVQDIVRPQIDAKKINYVVERNGVSQLFGDNQHLHRVFMNLLSNAIKYTPESGTIKLSLKKQNNTITAGVSDNGCGIPPDDLPKLFQEFYRSSDPINQQIKGTGLGLALAKRIVEAHQGKIWVESERGKGTTFLMDLPASA